MHCKAHRSRHQGMQLAIGALAHHIEWRGLKSADGLPRSFPLVARVIHLLWSMRGPRDSHQKIVIEKGKVPAGSFPWQLT
jgi:hypothetical protein